MPAGSFLTIWQSESALRTALGCPTSYHPRITPDAWQVNTAYQPFERGEMIWSDHIGWYAQPTVYVLYADSSYQRLDDTFDPAADPIGSSETPPNGLVEPLYGFGKVWREQPGVREALGWAITTETPGVGRFQMLQGGDMVWISQTNQTYVFRHDKNTTHVFNVPFSEPLPTGEEVQWIAFLSGRESEVGLYVVSIEGYIIRLTDSETRPWHFSWSPDGERIAFGATRGENTDIYVTDADGSNLVRLTDHNADDRSPAWSPDGSRIAFTSNRDGHWGIYVMDADGNNPVSLTDIGSGDYPPRWSPDGQRIAFMSWDGHFEIYVINADGSNLTRLTTSQWSVEPTPPISPWSVEPDWSPDGQRILFMSTRDNDSTQIYMVNVDGSGLVRLTDEAANSYPAWSPDGKHITFMHYHADQHELYVMEADGNNPVRLTNTGYHSPPQWSPDGKRIAFMGEHDGHRDIYVINADGSNLLRLTDNQDAGCPAWSP